MNSGNIIDDIAFKLDRSKWKLTKLGDVSSTKSVRENNPSKSKFDKFVGSSCINEYDLRVQNWEDTSTVTSAMKVFNQGEYLLVRRSVAGNQFKRRAARADFDGICSGDIINIRENDEYISDGFLAYVLYSDSFWEHAISNASGSITSRVKWKDLANYEFLLPPKDQQTQLAKLLWAMDEVIEREKALQLRLLNLRECLHKEHFTDYRRSKFRIGEFSSKVGSGVTPKGGSKVYLDSGVRLIRSQNVLYGEFDFSDIAHISEAIDEKMSSSRVQNDDVLLNITGASIGRSSVYTDNEKANVNQHVCIIRTNNNLNPWFLSEFINSRYGQNQIQLMQAGGNREGLNFANIRLMKFPEFNEIQQEELLKQFFAIRDGYFKSRSKVESSQSLQKSLINQVF